VVSAIRPNVSAAVRATYSFAPMKSRSLILACAALLSLGLSVTAASARGCRSRVEATTYEIKLRGTHGYEIEIVSSRRGVVTLTASKANSFAQYEVAGRSNEQGLAARFGRLGRVSLHFARPRREGFAAETVGLKGKIEFHGEQGFTAVAASRVEAFVSRKFKRACSSPSSGGRAPAALSRAATERGLPFVATVAAAETTPDRAVGLKVRHSQPVGPGDGDVVIAILKEHREGMTIRRFASAAHLDRDGGLIASAPGAVPIAGTLAPSFPFSGTATYSGTSGATASWSGDLKAWVPGAGYVPLTGPGFSSLLCGGEEATKQLDACEDEVDDLLRASTLI
jgi:hypothetical protein